MRTAGGRGRTERIKSVHKTHKSLIIVIIMMIIKILIIILKNEIFLDIVNSNNVIMGRTAKLPKMLIF